MKKLGILLMMVFGLGLAFQSCNNGKTYAEMKEDEREAIQRFIEKNEIKVIDEDQFAEQDSMTNVAANEYVLFEESGVYMQVVERGNGELLEETGYVKELEAEEAKQNAIVMQAEEKEQTGELESTVLFPTED